MVNDEVLFKEPLVELIAVSKHLKISDFGPEQLSAYGAFGCFEEKTPIQIYESIPEDKRRKREETVLRESAGRGHGSVADQNSFTFVIEDLTRAATLQLCSPHYLAHLQQSLRRATANRAFFVPEQLRQSSLFNEVKQVLFDSFLLYEKMSGKGVPKEDARFLLPLYTKTNIQTTGDARELMHLYAMNKQGEVPSAVTRVVDEMIRQASSIAPNLFKDWGFNYEVLAWYPAAQLYASQNKTVNEIIKENNHPKEPVFFEHELSEEAVDRAVKERNEAELANLKHVHNAGKMNGFLIPMSLACFHQAIRQRTWDHSVESIYDAASRGEFITPPSVKGSEFVDEFNEQNRRMLELYKSLVQEGVERKEAIGVLPHSLMIYDVIHVNGWNLIHSIGKRTCTEAQWEIRAIANKLASIAREKNPIAAKYSLPQGVTYGKCPERNPCGLCDRIRKELGL